MSKVALSYRVVDLTPARRDTPNFLDLVQARHSMYGLLEVDVTVARRFIAEHKARTGEALSFTGYLVFCLAHAVDEDKSVQAYLKGRKKLVLFDDVDVGITVERQMGATQVPVGHVVRRANHKTYLDIHREIRSVQTEPVPAGKGIPSWVRFILLLPWPVPGLLVGLLRAARRRDPTGPAGIVPTGGTVAVTAVGMFGHRSGWALTPTAHSLMLVVGGIGRKPAVAGDRIEPRDMLCLTVAFDHDIVDGAPAARFVQKLVELIESGYGLEQAEPAAAPQPVSNPV